MLFYILSICGNLGYENTYVGEEVWLEHNRFGMEACLCTERMIADSAYWHVHFHSTWMEATEKVP